MKNLSGIVAWYSADRIPGILSCSSNIKISLIKQKNCPCLQNSNANLNCEWRIIAESQWVFHLEPLCGFHSDFVYSMGENGCFMSQMSQWVRNNKIKHYFYLICLLASLLPAHARPISDMKSQPGLFVSSIPGPATTTTCMPRKIAFPDTLQEPIKPSDNPYY